CLPAMGHAVRNVSGVAAVREIPATRGHAYRARSIRTKPIRHRSRPADAARQARALPKLPAEEHRMIHCRAHLPLVGDPMYAAMGRVKPKTKTFLKRKNQGQFGGSPCLPLVGPEGSQNHQKGHPTSASLPFGFQAHPSMRICFLRRASSLDFRGFADAFAASVAELAIHVAARPRPFVVPRAIRSRAM